ncbi:MAG: glycosyltransferase [Candidatus Latescibacterota bacterium]|nr:MAG: glycosyltransferase [Candidatus Latescibacterota bacterium]
MAEIAVLIPCYNEETTIGRVVADFRKELPEAKIYVYDNNSTDLTAPKAAEAGAIVKSEPKPGKGNVVRSMFRDVDADVYVMVDGDATYPSKQVHELIEPVLEQRADVTVGVRLETYTDKSFRRFHKFGNELIKNMINVIFGTKLRDILSGYRCFNKRFVKTSTVLSRGFEVETELTLQAIDRNFVIEEIPIEYRERPAGSYSKLNTYVDAVLIIRTIFWIFKDYKPLKFFSTIGVIGLLLGFGLGGIPVIEFFKTGKVTHPSTSVLAAGIVMLSFLSFVTGMILDTIGRRNREIFQLIADQVIRGPK